jgi:hypothetical protein
MTQEDIIRMAREVGLWPAVTDNFSKELVALAALVAAAEREACAKVCDEMEEKAEEHGTECCKWPTPSDCAFAIRARGNNMTTHITKTWFDGEKIVTQEIPESEVYQQEPVAWGVFEGNLHDMFFTQEEAQEMADLKGSHAEVRPLYTAPPQPEQKPMHPQIQKMYEDYFDKCFRESSALDAAVQAEREACAKVCDHMASRCNDIRAAALESAAENIKARGQA